MCSIAMVVAFSLCLVPSLRINALSPSVPVPSSPFESGAPYQQTTAEVKTPNVQMSFKIMQSALQVLALTLPNLHSLVAFQPTISERSLHAPKSNVAVFHELLMKTNGPVKIQPERGQPGYKRARLKRFQRRIFQPKRLASEDAAAAATMEEAETRLVADLAAAEEDKPGQVIAERNAQAATHVHAAAGVRMAEVPEESQSPDEETRQATGRQEDAQREAWEARDVTKRLDEAWREMLAGKNAAERQAIEEWRASNATEVNALLAEAVAKRYPDTKPTSILQAEEAAEATPVADAKLDAVKRPKWHVCRPSITDVDEIADMLCDLNRGISSQLRILSKWKNRRYLTKRLKSRGRFQCLRVVRQGDEVLGFAEFGFTRGSPFSWMEQTLMIGNLVVKRDFRRQGIAEALLLNLEKTARSLGKPTLKVAVEMNNIPAVNLYLKRSYGWIVEEDGIGVLTRRLIENASSTSL